MTHNYLASYALTAPEQPDLFASVPDYVHTILLARDLIPNPYDCHCAEESLAGVAAS